MAMKGDDCYFYYYSTCSKGDSCPFRHQPAALGNEMMCTLWEQGKCFKDACAYRHMMIEVNRNNVPCYFETQLTGCLKPQCPFQHARPRPFQQQTPVVPVQFPASESPTSISNGILSTQSEESSCEQTPSQQSNNGKPAETKDEIAAADKPVEVSSMNRNERPPPPSSQTNVQGQMPIQSMYSMNPRHHAPPQHFNHHIPGPPRPGFSGHPVSARPGPGFMPRHNPMHRPGLMPFPRNMYNMRQGVMNSGHMMHNYPMYSNQMNNPYFNMGMPQMPPGYLPPNHHPQREVVGKKYNKDRERPDKRPKHKERVEKGRTRDHDKERDRSHEKRPRSPPKREERGSSDFSGSSFSSDDEEDKSKCNDRRRNQEDLGKRTQGRQPREEGNQQRRRARDEKAKQGRNSGGDDKSKSKEKKSTESEEKKTEKMTFEIKSLEQILREKALAKLNERKAQNAAKLENKDSKERVEGGDDDKEKVDGENKEKIDVENKEKVNVKNEEKVSVENEEKVNVETEDDEDVFEDSQSDKKTVSTTPVKLRLSKVNNMSNEEKPASKKETNPLKSPHIHIKSFSDIMKEKRMRRLGLENKVSVVENKMVKEMVNPEKKDPQGTKQSIHASASDPSLNVSKNKLNLESVQSSPKKIVRKISLRNVSLVTAKTENVQVSQVGKVAQLKPDVQVYKPPPSAASKVGETKAAADAKVVKSPEKDIKIKSFDEIMREKRQKRLQNQDNSEQQQNVETSQPKGTVSLRRLGRFGKVPSKNEEKATENLVTESSDVKASAIVKPIQTRKLRVIRRKPSGNDLDPNGIKEESSDKPSSTQSTSTSSNSFSVEATTQLTTKTVSSSSSLPSSNGIRSFTGLSNQGRVSPITSTLGTVSSSAPLKPAGRTASSVQRVTPLSRAVETQVASNQVESRNSSPDSNTSGHVETTNLDSQSRKRKSLDSIGDEIISSLENTQDISDETFSLEDEEISPTKKLKASPPHIAAIEEAVTQQLIKTNEDILSDDDLDLAISQLSPVNSDDEYNDVNADDLLMELEEMINS